MHSMDNTLLEAEIYHNARVGIVHCVSAVTMHSLSSSYSIGNVVCSVDNPAKVTNRIEARIIIFNIEIPITIGFPVSV